MQETSAPMSTVLNDGPEEMADLLGYQPYADTLANLIASPSTQSPLTIGIFGSWGSGKTSLMKMIQSRLETNNQELLDHPISSPVPDGGLVVDTTLMTHLTHTIWFNAWLYSKEETLWRALIAQTIAGIRDMPLPPGYDDPYERQRKRERLDAMSIQLYRVVTEADLGSFSISGDSLVQKQGAKAADFTVTLQQGLDLLENLAAAEFEGEAEEAVKLRSYVREATAELEQARVESLVRFQEQFQEMVEEFVLPYGYLIVFVDDLDRCLPDKAVEVLEAMKLFMDVPGCIFVLGIDQDVIERGIRLRYRELGSAGLRELIPFLIRSVDLGDNAAEFRQFIQKLAEPEKQLIDGGRYLEKIIQIPFVLPPISQQAMAEFIVGSVPNLPHPQCVRVFAEHLERNPRQVKRAINIFTLLWRLSQSGSSAKLKNLIQPVRLAKVVVLQQRHEEIYDHLREDPSRLITWEEQLRQEQTRKELNEKDLEKARLRQDLAKIELEKFLADENTEILAAREGTEVEKLQTEKEAGTLQAEKEVEKLQAEAERSILDEEIDDYEELAALRSLMLMEHPQSGPEATPYVSFDDISREEAHAYVFLASAVEDAGRTPEEEAVRPRRRPITGADEEKVEAVVDDTLEHDQVEGDKVGGDLFGDVKGTGIAIGSGATVAVKGLDEPEFIGVGARLSESAIGTFKQRAYRLMESLSTLAPRGGEFPLEARSQFINSVAEIGNALFHEVLGSEQEPELLKQRLAGESPIIVSVNRRLLHLPWEIVAESFDPAQISDAVEPPDAAEDSDGDKLVDFFWGFKRVIQRPLRDISPYESWHEGVRVKKDRPEIVLALDEKSRQSQAIMETFDHLVKEREIILHLTYDLEKFWSFVREGIGDIIYIHGRGSQFRKELWIELGGERLNYSRLDYWNQSNRRLVKGLKPSSRKEPPGDGKRKPGAALYILDTNASMGRRSEWQSWLEVFHEIGAGAVLAPMAAPNLTWSGLFLEKFIDAVLRGEEIGQALLAARNEFLHDTGNPLSLYFALFGDVRQRLRPMSEEDDPNADQVAI